VKQQKKEELSPEGHNKYKDNIWKVKSREKSRIIKRQNQRISELEKSRDLWKNKYNTRTLPSAKFGILDSAKAAHHQYPLLVVLWILQLQTYGKMSLRSCRHCLSSLYLILGINSRVPCHGTIRNWLCKSGYHRIKSALNEEEKCVIYVDESIVLGGEKLLLVLGIRQSQIPTDKSVSHQDMDVLHVSSAKEWKGDDISVILEEIGKKREILYVVSDEGSNLKKAYSTCNYIHIEDCTHIFANHLKRIYANDATFIAFEKLIGTLRKSWFLSKEKSRFMPPSMRGKLRFANIFPCVSWAKKHLGNWDNTDNSIRENLIFLKEHEYFIEELIIIDKLFKSVCKILKNKGFGSVQKQSILQILSIESKNANVVLFIKNIAEYLDNLTIKSATLETDLLLCSSDIIESFFGKFKLKIAGNSPIQTSEFIFTIANFSKNFTEDGIRKALESIKIKDLKKNKN
jgi:hypothetical protein